MRALEALRKCCKIAVKNRPADEVSSDDTESSKSSLTKSGTSVERMGQRTLTRGTWDREGNVL